MEDRERILNQTYISANDLKLLIPQLGINKCREYIKEIVDEQRAKGNFIPSGRMIIAPTKYVRKKFGI